MSEDEQKIIEELRATAISQPGLITIHQLLRDFKAFNGYPLNYRNFGYRTPEDFLKATNAFLFLKNNNNETCVRAKPSDDSQHISDMVRKQKSSGRRKHAEIYRQPAKSDHSWKKSSSSYLSSVYQALPSSPSKPRKPNTLSKITNKSNGDNNNNSNIASKSNQNYSKLNASNTSKPLQELSQSADLRDTLNRRKLMQAPQAKNMNPPQSNGQSSAVSLQNSFSTNQPQGAVPPFSGNTTSFENEISVSRSSLQNRLGVKTPTEPEPRTHGLVNQQNHNPFTSGRAVTLNDRLRNLTIERNFDSNERLCSPYENIPNRGSFNKSGLSNRLEVKTSVERTLPSPTTAQANTNKFTFGCPTNNDFNPFNPSVICNDLKTTYTEKKATTSSASFDFDANENPITSLTNYCRVQGYAMPKFEVIKLKFTKAYCCHVHVKDSTFSTYPEDFATEVEAKVACARKAIEEIRAACSDSHYPVCLESDTEIAYKIYQEVTNHPHGIFCKNIPDVFRNSYKQKLPEHWLSIIHSSRYFLLEATAGDNLIVFPKSGESETPTPPPLESEFLVMDKLCLPWTSKYWNLHITNCVSTVEIWARLVGREYSDKLDSLMNDIDVYMLTKKVRPASIKCGQIYLVSVSECWQRVQVEHINKSTGVCLCLFIDFGDEEWLAMQDLFICEPEFLQLAPQAISFSLFGLEDFAENPSAKKHLDETLIGRSLVGEILTKREQFEADNDDGGNLQVILYDTSSSEDVNLNPLILNKICDDTPPPQLDKTSVTNVNITNIANGDIFLQIKSPSLSYVEKLIQQLVEAKFNEEDHRVTPEDMRPSNMFLIKDTQRWYRGTLADNESKVSNWEYRIFYVDYGITNVVNITRIFRLDSLSAALNKFPKQAVKVRLHNIPPVTESILAHIKGLLPVECSAIVKIAVNAIIPQVNIFRRIDGYMVRVNDVILSEHELENDNVLEINSSNENLTNEKKNYSPTLTPTSSDISLFARGNALKSPITVPSSPRRGELPKLANALIPPTNDDFSVFVTIASNPNNFVVQPYDDGPSLRKLMGELNDYCKNNEEYIPKDMLEVEQAYAARWVDGCYQRVVIKNIFPKNSTVHIYYCDFGVNDVVSVDNLRTLPMKFRHLPKQAISASLYGVKPKHVDWRPEDCIRFKELTEKRGFASVVKKVSDDPIHSSTTIVQLQLVDVSTEVDVLIERILIDEGRATPAI